MRKAISTGAQQVCSEFSWCGSNRKCGFDMPAATESRGPALNHKLAALIINVVSTRHRTLTGRSKAWPLATAAQHILGTWTAWRVLSHAPTPSVDVNTASPRIRRSFCHGGGSMNTVHLYPALREK